MDNVQTSSMVLDKVLVTIYRHPDIIMYHASAECHVDTIHEIAISGPYISKNDAAKDAVSKLIVKCIPIIKQNKEEI
jgi:hypothetical protein